MENILQRSAHSGPEYQAYVVLKIGFVIAPLIAGLDKFFNNLTDWTKYLAPIFPDMFNMTPATFMSGAGIIEIIVALGVAIKPKIFGYVVSAWLMGIFLNLLMLGMYYDVALRDLGLAFGAFAMARLATHYEATSGFERYGSSRGIGRRVREV